MNKLRRKSVAEKSDAPDKGGPKDPPDWEKWVTHRHLRRELAGVGAGTVYELLKEAGISPHQGEDGSKKYPPDTVSRLKPLMLEDDHEASEVGPELVIAASKLVKISEEHNRLFVEVMTKPMQIALATLETINRQQAERLAVLEAASDSAIRARENLLSEVAARDIAAREHIAKEARKDQAWGMIVNRAPVLLDQITSTVLGKSDSVKTKVNAAIELLQLIKPEQMMALRASGFLTPEQIAKVDKILGTEESPEGANAPDTKTTNGKKESKSNAGSNVP